MPQPLISIIEDDESMRLALSGLVRSLGFDVGEHGSAIAFLDSAECELCGCIITDIQMPDLSGIELKERLNQMGCRVPVIMITARVEEDLRTRAFASGAFCFLQKPFDAKLLIDSLERAIGC